MSTPLPFNPALQHLPVYQPGRPIEEVARELGLPAESIIKLASNENPLGPSPAALAAMQKVLTNLHLYPDGNAFYLKLKLADKLGVEPKNLILGNGSNEIIEFVGHALMQPGADVVVSQYCFAVYPIVTHLFGANLVSVPAKDYGHDLPAMLEAITPATRVIFVANPNNPTGTWVSADALRRFIAGVPEQTLVVVDEAYIEYVSESDFPDASRWLGEFPNLIVTRTFSKVYGLAGLRVGYALSHPSVADMLNRVRQPFNVNAIALAAALAALDDSEHLKRSVETNRAGMAQLRAGFDALGVRHLPSAGNFVMIDCGRPAPPVYEAMLRRGVIVRPVGNYGLPNHLRITIGTREQNERMLAALKQALP